MIAISKAQNSSLAPTDNQGTNNVTSTNSPPVPYTPDPDALEKTNEIKIEHEIDQIQDESDSYGRAARIAGDDMDDAEKYLEEYGNVNISAPILAKLSTSEFNFDLNRGATNYYCDAKNQVQAAAASFQQTVQSLSASAQVQVDPTVAAAYAAQLSDYFSGLQRYQNKQTLGDLAAQQQYEAAFHDATNADQRAAALAAYAEEYNGGSNAPVFPTDNGSGTNLPADASTLGRPGVTNVLSSQQFQPYQGLISSLANPPQPALSDRSAIITSAGDSATESIFRHFMGNTNLNSDSAEDNLYFGLSTVSVNPGWRTEKGWAAEVMMSAEITYTTGRLAVACREFDRVTGNSFDATKAIPLYKEYQDDIITKAEQKAQIQNWIATNNQATEALQLQTNQHVLSTISTISRIPDDVVNALNNYTNIMNRVTNYVQVNFKTNAPLKTMLGMLKRDSDEESIDESFTQPFSTPLLELFPPYDFTATEILQEINVNSNELKEQLHYVTNSDVTELDEFLVSNKEQITNSPFFSPELENEVSKLTDSVKPENLAMLKDIANKLQLANEQQSSSISTNAGRPYGVITNASFLSTTVPVPVTVISPLIDTDTQDLSDSTRSQVEFAMALSAALQGAGYGGAAKVFEQYVKNKQYDIRTVSQSADIDAFSSADGGFGFQIGPRLQALDNPAKASGPSQVLDRQSFPVLLILALDGADIAPKLWEHATNRLMVLEPQIHFTETRRWTPMKHYYSRDGAFFAFWSPKQFLNRPVSESKRMDMIYKLKQARRLIALTELSASVTNSLLKRIDTLESQLAGGEGNISLAAGDIVPDIATNAPPAPSTITTVIPSQLALDTNQPPASQQFVLLGTGLESVATNCPCTNVTVVPSDVASLFNPTNINLQRIGSALLLTMNINSNSTASALNKALLFQLATTNGSFVLSMPVSITSAPSTNKPPASSSGNPLFSFSNTGTNGSGGYTYNVTFSTNSFANAFDSAKVLDMAKDLIKSDLEKNKPDVSTSNTVLNITVKPGISITNGTLQVPF